MCECKVIHIQIPKSNQICSFLKLLEYFLLSHRVNKYQVEIQSNCWFLTLLDSISRLTLIWCWTKFNTIHINYNILSMSTNIRLLYECKVIHIPKSNEIRSFLTILDSISRLTLICFDIGQNSIRYTLTTIYYPFCQQILGCYSVRV